MRDDAGAVHGKLTFQTVSLGGFVLLFVASRLLYVALIDPARLLSGEELYRGTIAQELATGLTMRFPEYRADNYSGGSLVIGALAAGFFRLFGPTLFALKLAPLFLFTLALLFWYWTIQRYAGERVAGYFAMLFCFSPPLFTGHSVTAMGFHSESIVFSALTAFLLFGMLSEDKPSRAYPVLLGLTAGIGLWFAYIYGLTLLALLVFWFWHDTGMFRRPRVLWFALGFVAGFSPWIIINAQTHFAGLVVRSRHVWEHFGLDHLWVGLAHPRRLSPYEFFADIASDETRNLPRRAVNLLYALLYLVPILTAGVVRLKTGSAPAGPNPARPSLVEFGILYLVVFGLAVQFSDFRAVRFNIPAYPFLFLLTADSVARCEALVGLGQRAIQTVFLASVVVLGLGTHAPLLSLDRPGGAFSVKGYAYAMMPATYTFTHAAEGADEREFREFVLALVHRPFFSDILPRLSHDDQRELSGAIALLLADVTPLNGQPEEFTRIERLVPPGFETFFYYQVGGVAMDRHRGDFARAAAAVDFLRHRSPAAHHLALVGVYRSWLDGASLDGSLEAVVDAPVSVAPELARHYWRALGRFAGRSWYDRERSLSQVNAHVQLFVSRLDPSVRRPFLQGVGEYLLIAHLVYYTAWAAPAELERFPLAYQGALLEGWGMALGELERSAPSWSGHASILWTLATKGLSARSVVAVRQGKAEFDSLFEASGASPRK